MSSLERDLQPSRRADQGAQRPRILIVDDEEQVRDVLARKLSKLGTQTDQCGDGFSALGLLNLYAYDLVISDVKLPALGGIVFLRRARERYPDLAVILITSGGDLQVAVDSLRFGAYDFILKPFSMEEVSISVSRALEKRRLLIENRRYQQTLEEQVVTSTQQLKEALEVLERNYHSTLVALGTALDSRDADTDGHSLRVTLYTLRLARQLGLSPENQATIEQGALLHDIGKIGVPDGILRKPEKLTESEWVCMQKHPEIGYRILSGIQFLRGAAQMVLEHQERFDGSGYPSGLKGDQITLGARIFAVADTLDCMTSNRPFQKATTFEKARDEIMRLSNSQLDPRIVRRFMEIQLEEWRDIRREVAERPWHASEQAPKTEFSGLTRSELLNKNQSTTDK